MMDLKTILTAPGKGEHLGPDGLLYCDSCGKPRQTVVNFLDTRRTLRCLCPCQQEKIQGERDRLRRQEELDRFARMRSVAMQDPALRQCTFAVSRHNEGARRTAENYVNQWEDMQARGMGLLFWGGVGTGKTFLAACIANALLDRGIPVMVTSFGRILGAMPSPASGEQTAAIDELMRYPLLVLDDLGVERDTPYTMELVYHIIDARYRSGKPLIVTTNLGLNQLENPDSLEKARIYDRVLERCVPVRVEGEQLRAAGAHANREQARKLLVGR